VRATEITKIMEVTEITDLNKEKRRSGGRTESDEQLVAGGPFVSVAPFLLVDRSVPSVPSVS
jgi:hypothetical protein